MNALLPCVSESLDDLRLTIHVLGSAVLHVTLAGRYLPVRSEPDAVGWVDVDRLHLALQALFLSQRGHHEERIPQDHPVRPVLIPVVEIHSFAELLGEPIEI